MPDKDNIQLFGSNNVDVSNNPVGSAAWEIIDFSSTNQSSGETAYTQGDISDSQNYQFLRFAVRNTRGDYALMFKGLELKGTLRQFFIVQNKFDLKYAINEWIANEDAAKTKYGSIDTWDVSLITDMSGVFAGTSFNDDISNWNVFNVTNMTNMFGPLPDGIASLSAENKNKIHHSFKTNSAWLYPQIAWSSTPFVTELEIDDLFDPTNPNIQNIFHVPSYNDMLGNYQGNIGVNAPNPINNDTYRLSLIHI